MSEEQIQLVQWQEQEATLSGIRFKVFVEEQNVSEHEEWDGLDNIDGTVQFMISAEGEAVGCARLLQTGQIGRMAILKQHRNKKLGAALLRQMMEFALEQQFIDGDYSPLWLNAQIQALPFYQKMGFCPEGEEFLDAGIAHKKMVFVHSGEALQNLYKDKVIRLSNPGHFSQHLFQMAQISNRKLDILCENLDGAIWGKLKLADAISAFARKSRYSRVRILLSDIENLNSERKPLIELCKRLHSHMEIRVLKNDDINLNHSYCLADSRHLVFFNSEKDYQGFANYSAAAECHHFEEEFDRLWEHHGEHDENMKVLVI
ncbi:Predicted N-acyltransferase, GNAT family [Alteromonadaceae bacterium Bs31]|nr:Predicted N-acyltransferase, GNAT family [Alteromonadaceae bacterium Bs31]